jgi:hypothetical protein
LLRDEIQRAAIELAERAADKQAEPGSLAAILKKITNIQLGRDERPTVSGLCQTSKGDWNFFVRCTPQNDWYCNPAGALCTPAPWGNPSGTANDCRAMDYFHGGRSVAEAEERAQCDMVRELVGTAPPHLPFRMDWLTDSVRRLAEACYADREMPSGYFHAGHVGVLADALEEAGCTDADILSHCRGPGPHVRGCWVVDLLLGKQ